MENIYYAYQLIAEHQKLQDHIKETEAQLEAAYAVIRKISDHSTEEGVHSLIDSLMKKRDILRKKLEILEMATLKIEWDKVKAAWKELEEVEE